MQQQQQASPPFTRNLNGLLFVCGAMSMTVEVFLHKSSTFGCRYLGKQAAIGLLFLLLWPAFWPDLDPVPMMWFFAATILMCVFVRAGTSRRRQLGEPEPHSHYNGTPRFMRERSPISEVAFKRIIEPALVWVAALVAMDWNRPLGVYLFWAGIALLISVVVSEAHARTRALDMNDALIEQRGISDRWRRMRPQ